MFTIPSLALFVILGPVTGFLSRTTAVMPLAAYTLLILVRNTVTGLDGVPPEVKEAAIGMGYTQTRRLLRVELPLGDARDHRRRPHRHRQHRRHRHRHRARSARAGSGSCLLDGFQRDFQTPLTVGIVLSLALAVVADLLLLGALTSATPWRRKGRR